MSTVAIHATVRRCTRWLAWTVAALTMVAVLAAAGLSIVADTDAVMAVVTLSFVVATGVTGVVLTSRLPDHPVGWLLQASACTFAFGALLVSYLEVATTVSDWLPVSPAVVWLGDVMFGTGTAICATWLLLLFPTGSLLSSRWRIVAWLAGVALVALTMGVMLGPDAFQGTTLTNPVSLDPDGVLLLALEGGGSTCSPARSSRRWHPWWCATAGRVTSNVNSSSGSRSARPSSVSSSSARPRSSF